MTKIGKNASTVKKKAKIRDNKMLKTFYYH